MRPKASLHYRQRLKSRSLIETLFKEGTAINQFPYRVVVLCKHKEAASTPGMLLQAGFSVSSKKFKRAVDRNRIKRLTREAYRTRRGPLEELLEKQQKQALIFFIYTGKELPEFVLAEEKMDIMIKKLIQHCSEKTPANT